MYAEPRILGRLLGRLLSRLWSASAREIKTIGQWVQVLLEMNTVLARGALSGKCPQCLDCSCVTLYRASAISRLLGVVCWVQVPEYLGATSIGDEQSAFAWGVSGTCSYQRRAPIRDVLLQLVQCYKQ